MKTKYYWFAGGAVAVALAFRFGLQNASMAEYFQKVLSTDIFEGSPV